MRQTAKMELDISKKILLDTKELQAMLSCGRYTAVKIGTDAASRVDVGNRVLWNRKKVEKYIGEISL